MTLIISSFCMTIFVSSILFETPCIYTSLVYFIGDSFVPKIKNEAFIITNNFLIICNLQEHILAVKVKTCESTCENVTRLIDPLLENIEYEETDMHKFFSSKNNQSNVLLSIKNDFIVRYCHRQITTHVYIK